MILPFNFASIPKIVFGAGKLPELYSIIPKFGKNVLFVIGGSSLQKSGKWDEIIENIEMMEVNHSYVSLKGEPSPQIIDSTAEKYRNENIDLIVGIGGGSVTDAGKAISAMLPKQDSIKNYLEGVGTKKPDGEKIPYIAIPTTSGTGSEATKNAVISQIGVNGFKKSLRHDNYIPNIAIIDPELMINCPPSITAACGMDAFTQLLESYVSTKANPMTDALAYSGMKYIKDNIIPACGSGAEDIKVRTSMAYGSLMSGITLANAGLGIIHGLASPIGGFFKVPHGVVCGTLLSEATRINIQKLKESESIGRGSLRKHAQVGALLMDEKFQEGRMYQYLDVLIETLEVWTENLNIQKLGHYGVAEEYFDKIVENASLKNNPVKLDKNEIKNILKNRL